MVDTVTGRVVGVLEARGSTRPPSAAPLDDGHSDGGAGAPWGFSKQDAAAAAAIAQFIATALVHIERAGGGLLGGGGVVVDPLLTAAVLAAVSGSAGSGGSEAGPWATWQPLFDAAAAGALRAVARVSGGAGAGAGPGFRSSRSATLLLSGSLWPWGGSSLRAHASRPSTTAPYTVHVGDGGEDGGGEDCLWCLQPSGRVAVLTPVREGACRAAPLSSPSSQHALMLKDTSPLSSAILCPLVVCMHPPLPKHTHAR